MFMHNNNFFVIFSHSANCTRILGWEIKEIKGKHAFDQEKKIFKKKRTKLIARTRNRPRKETSFNIFLFSFISSNLCYLRWEKKKSKILKLFFLGR